jgi:putative hemolysin
MGATAQLPVIRGNRLYADLASGPEDVRAAQALRHRVFGEEMGARLKGHESDLDVDEFDAVCQHLLVRESRSERVVGCTRLLTDENARRIGRFYSEGEFDLGPIQGLPGRLLEVGRTCIAPEYRQGAGIAVLWAGLAGFIRLQGIDYLFGCASMPLGEQDMQAAARPWPQRTYAWPQGCRSWPPLRPTRCSMPLFPPCSRPISALAQGPAGSLAATRTSTLPMC